MRQGRWFLMGLLAAVVIMPCFAREPLTLEGLKEAAAADAATPEGQAYLKEFFTNPFMLAWDSADGFLEPPHDGFAIYMPVKHVEPGTETPRSASAR